MTTFLSSVTTDTSAVHSPADEAPTERHLTIRPWHDPVIDSRGFDPRSEYVEEFWLGILGPSTTLLLRRVARSFDVHPEGFELDLIETAGALGLGSKSGRHSPFNRALERCVVFGMARHHPDGALAVRLRLPPLASRHLRRLSSTTLARHETWLADHDRPRRSLAEVRRRAQQLALSLARIGEDARCIEIQLLRWGVHPSLTRESATWALAQPGVKRRDEASPCHS